LIGVVPVFVGHGFARLFFGCSISCQFFPFAT
jgi:hypothetical protein